MLARRQEIVGLVEQAMTQAGAYKHANEDVKEQWFELLVGIVVPLVEPLHEEKAECEPYEPAQSVPTYAVMTYVKSYYVGLPIYE